MRKSRVPTRGRRGGTPGAAARRATGAWPPRWVRTLGSRRRDLDRRREPRGISHCAFTPQVLLPCSLQKLRHEYGALVHRPLRLRRPVQRARPGRRPARDAARAVGAPRLGGGAPVLLFEPPALRTWAPCCTAPRSAASCRTGRSDGAERASLRSHGERHAVAALRLAALRGAGRACAVGVSLGMGSTSMEQWHPIFPRAWSVRPAATAADRPRGAPPSGVHACWRRRTPPAASCARSCGVVAYARLTHSAAMRAAAVNATPLWCYDRAPQRWSTPRRATTNLYTALVGKVARASASARARFGGSALGFVWFQGENELNGLRRCATRRPRRVRCAAGLRRSRASSLA